MSPIRRIVAHVNDSPRTGEPVRLAAALAQQHGAEVAAMYAVAPLTAAYLTPEVSAAAAEVSAKVEAERQATATARVAAAAPQVTLDLSAAQAWGDPVAALLRASRTADLLVLGQNDPSAPDGTGPGFAGRVLTGAGCPVLFVPFIDWSVGLSDRRTTCGRRVLVAWSDRRESARALRDALPLLAHAEQVELVQFGHAGDGATERRHMQAGLAAAVDHLRRHGITASCTVRVSREPSLGERLRRSWVPDTSVAEALLSYAADADVDLIVMGGYGHPRAWELALGGVTRTLLHTMTVPVLMSH